MSLESEIRKIITPKIINEDKDCDICGDDSPCTCEESQEVNEDYDAKKDHNMDPTSHVMRNKETGMFCVYDVNNKKVAEFKTKGEADAYAKKNHDDLMKKEAINHADAHTDAQQHSNGSMSVKKIPSMLKKPGDKHLHLHMKSYHKEKDGQAFAKKHGYKVSNYVKTGAGSRMNIHKESDDLMKKEDIRTLPRDKQRALQHADKTAKPKSKVSLAPTPGIKTEETNLDEAFEQFFTEGYEGEVKKVLDKKGIDAYFKNGKLMVSKRDKPMVMQILKRQDFDMPTIQVEEIRMENNRFGLSDSLVDAVANVLAGKRPVDEMKMKKDDEDEKKKAKKAPVTDKDDDGDGMDPVGREDGDIDNDGDKDDTDKYLAKRRKAIGKAMKGEKKGSKEPIDTKPKMDEEKQKKEDATPVKEGDMTDAQMKRREEIVKELKKKSAEFESRYGDKADAVMYATATKMAMKGK